MSENIERSEKAQAILEIINSIPDEKGKNEVIDIVNEDLSKNPAVKTIARIGKTEKRVLSKPACPHCGSENVVANGSVHGIRRYVCKLCKKSFGSSTGTVHKASKSHWAWDRFLEGTVCGDTLEQLSEKCGISLSTSHSWRIKLFRQLHNSNEGTVLQGVIQEDECYLSASFKGNKKALKNLGQEVDEEAIIADYTKYGFRDHCHMRGSSDRKRGLSRDKVCIATAVDSERKIIGEPACRGNVSSSGLQMVLAGRLDPSVVLVTDESKGGKAFAEENGIAHVALNSRKESRTGKAYNLQQINSVHSLISDMSHSRRSFATKYTSDYVTWIAWLSLNNDKNIKEKIEILKNLKVVGKPAPLITEVKATKFPKNLVNSSQSLT
jgi:transposase-like protein